MKSIIIITSEFPPLPGGIGNHACNLAKALQEQGFEVTVLTDFRTTDQKKEIAFDQALPFRVIRIPRYIPALRTYWQRWAQAYRLLQAKDAMIVLASGKFSLWLGALGQLLFPRHRYLAVVHGSEVNPSGRLSKCLTHWSFGRFEKRIAVSHFTAQLLLQVNADFDAKVIHNGFSPTDSETSDAPIKLSGYPALITVGNVTYRKGQQNVIKALPLIRQKYPQVHYHIVGMPTEKRAFLQLAKELGVAACITFHGVVSDTERTRLLQGADIFMMLSDHLANGDVEGFGIAILEANHLGIPAIGAEDSGVADAIKHKVSGILIDPHLPTRILEAIEDIMGQYSTYSESAGRWSKQFLWDKIILQYRAEIMGKEFSKKASAKF